MASRDIADLTPELRELAIEFMGECRRAGLSVVIICTYRNDAEQMAAYQCGASNCKPGESEHNALDVMKRPAARAFDIGVIRNGKYIGDGRDPDYRKAGEIGEALGLEWSGRWKGKLKEVGHYQLRRDA